METIIKNEITKEIKHLAERITQRAVAARAEVSDATISKIIAGNWDSLADGMWQKIMINLHIDIGWQQAETDNLRKIYNLCQGAQERSLAICISDNAGKGKSNGFRFFDRKGVNVIHLECKASWSKKSFLRNLLIAMGAKPEGTTEQLLEQFNKKIKSMFKPLLILDQADKLKDPQLDLFMEFYNDHEGHLGIILSGVRALEKRIDKGRNNRKIGYDEIYSRFGGRYIRLEGISRKDVAQVCIANGIDDQELHTMIYDTCGGDYRRVRREIQKQQLRQSKANNPQLELAN